MSKGFKTRKRYRLTFVNENTFNAVWSVRLSRTKVWALTAVCCAAIAALAVGIFAWSPLKNYLPGYIKESERRQIVDNTLLVDSMLTQTEVNRRYIDNLISVLSGPDSVLARTSPAAVAAEITDSLMPATENERAFVADWMERERGNLSVLTPVVAEGMMFRLPAVGARINADGSGLLTPAGATVVAIQDAAVISSAVDPLSGRITLVLQHSNDFVSVVGGLKASFVSVGRHVSAGQAIGAAGAEGELQMNVWHHGNPAPLSTLLPQ